MNRTFWQRRIFLAHGAMIAAMVLGLFAEAGKVDARPAAQSVGDPLVLAFYYTWFDENTWTYDKLSDLPAETYVSRDRGAMGRHIDQARAAGIDALLVAWYGPGGDNQTEPNLTALLDEAAARGFRIGVLFETNSPFFGGVGDVIAALQHLRNVHAQHPAFLKVDGRPVVFFWRPTIYGVDTWRSIRAQADPDGSSVWISEGVDTSYLAVFDGHHLYSNTWNPPADLTATNQKFAGRVASARDTYGSYKLWVATVMPGYDDTRIRGGGGFARGRDSGAYFVQSWQAAISSAPNWIVINSFNEWPEGTYIEPSAAYGDQFLSASASYSQQFKAGGTRVEAVLAPIAQAAAVAAPVAAEPEPEPDTPTAIVTTALLNVRAGPGTEYEIVAQLAQGSRAPISGKDGDATEWWQVQTEAGTGWVFGELVRAAGPVEQVQAVAFSATASPEVVPEAASVLAVEPVSETVTMATSGAASIEPAGEAAMPIHDPQRATLLPFLSR